MKFYAWPQDDSVLLVEDGGLPLGWVECKTDDCWRASLPSGVMLRNHYDTRDQAGAALLAIAEGVTA